MTKSQGGYQTLWGKEDQLGLDRAEEREWKGRPLQLGSVRENS